MKSATLNVAVIALGVVFVSGACADDARVAESVRKPAVASPNAARSPGLTEHDPASGVPEVGVGRAHNSVKGSGDEGGTAAGMPGKGPESPH